MPETTFTADECQALLDLLGRLLGVYRPDEVLGVTKEELAAVDKLRDAGSFYMPEIAARWDAELPAESGWYWTRREGKYDPTVAPVHVGTNGVWLDSSWYHVDLEPLFFEGREFFGPIQKPED